MGGYKMGLSKAQQEVINKMKKGLFIWTNEGADLKAWLGNNKGGKIEGLKIRTVETLFEKDKIKLLDGSHRQGLYKYGLNK